MIHKIRQLTASDWILLAAVLAVGSFHEYISCALCIGMCGILLWRMKKRENWMLPKSLAWVAAVAVSLGYGLSCLWAVDRGMAFVGFLKFLPLPLYLLCLQQEEKDGLVLSVLPYVAAAMAVISAIGMHLPGLKEAFCVADRLAGFFQYPNTFALLLLVCELLLLKKEKRTLWDYVTGIVLLAGLLYTGSRTVFVVAVLANVGMVFALSKKRVRTVLLLLGAGVAVAVVILAFNGNSVIGRFLRFSLTESTLVGRVLYAVDALPLLLRYPFGMGYMGYYYIQGSVQTGVYSVAYIHNELLQLLLDIGWIPTGLLVAALIKWFCKKRVPAATKIIAGALCLHSLFDFDLQYLGMFMLLFLLTWERGEPAARKAGGFGKALTAATPVLCLYMGIALALAHLGAYEAADAMYGANTRNKLLMLERATQVEQANALSDEILKTNTHYYAPYIMKAKYAYSQGDFAGVIENCNAAIEANPFDHTLYEEYCQMLIIGMDLYARAGDDASAQACAEELLAAHQKLGENAGRLSSLGKMIVDQPVTELSREVLDVIRQIGG